MSTIVSIGRQPPNSIVGEINLQQQQQNLMPIPACLTPTLALLTLIVPALISLIDLKFQKGSESVFQVHPVTTMVVVVSLLTFVMSLGIVLTFRTYHPSDVASSLAALLHTTVVFSGSLSLASLASLLLPDALRPFLYVCCALLSLGYLLSLVTGHYQEVHQRLMDKLHTLFSGMRAHMGGRLCPSLPTDIRDTQSVELEVLGTSLIPESPY